MENKIPKHVAIIPDGNRRWARSKGMIAVKGHEKSTEIGNVAALLEEAKRIGVKYFSIWGFSTENWKRSFAERKFLFSLILNLIPQLNRYAHKNKIKFRHIGRKDRLPEEVVSALGKFEKETENYGGLNMQLCLDYGGRDEIIRAVKKLIDEKTEVSEDSFLNYLDTAGIPDVDLIIRTGGEKRLSGFMPYQSAYSELYFSDVYFPDFSPAELNKAVKDFSERQRRFGGD